jgi:hypothetical protein
MAFGGVLPRKIALRRGGTEFLRVSAPIGVRAPVRVGVQHVTVVAPEPPAGNPRGPEESPKRPPPRRCGSKGPSNPAAVPWTPESSAAHDQEAMGGEGDGNR